MYTKRLYVSGGSFYELQAVFDHVPGVVATRTGYIDAQSEEPSYDAVKSGWIKAVMGLEIAYNPKKTDISQLLDILFAVVNPYEKDGQGAAKGPMYQSDFHRESRQTSCRDGSERDGQRPESQQEVDASLLCKSCASRKLPSSGA